MPVSQLFMIQNSFKKKPTRKMQSDLSPIGTKLNFMDSDAEGAVKEQNVTQYLASRTMDDILDDVLRLENFQLKQTNSSDDPRLQSQMLKGSGKTAEVDVDHGQMDPRLRNWNRMLEKRRRLQHRIERHTGKRAEDVLFNRSTTIDEASKRMILRVLDTADRSRPLDRLQVKSVLHSLKPRHDSELCRDIQELYAAEPQLQQVEFVGLPKITQMELASALLAPSAAESQWHQSEILNQRLETKKLAIQRVLEFAPDIQELQVIPAIMAPASTTPLVTKVGECAVLPLSEDSISEDEETEPDPELPTYEGDENSFLEPEVDIKDPVFGVEGNDIDLSQDFNGVLVNGTLFDYSNRSSATGKGINLQLKCDPHQRVVKTLLDVQNLSKKLVNVYWLTRSRCRNDRLPLNSELVFDRTEFILEPKERRLIRVMFQPQEVGLFTQRWAVYLVRSPFCGTRRLEVVLQGKCTMPETFRHRLERHQQVPLDKQQELQARALIQMQASLAPIIENPPLLCPYDRALDEREVFNAQNMSYRCERYADLEALKDLYALAKKPRDRPWDLSLDTMRHLISQQERLFLREKLHLRLVELLEPMKCNRCEALVRLERNPERERACFIYVRGAITSAVDEWEKMTVGLDDQFFKLEMLRYLEEQRTQLKEESEELGSQIFDRPAKGQQDKTRSTDDLNIVSKRLKASKYLRDSLYMHTYNLLCDAAEDIVSVIESTTHL
ncbi:hypothetical protein KR009_011684 [Drosophila setifemur]|nr:hypothetical protein KR009_011684 [Drosophila setifemur]